MAWRVCHSNDLDVVWPAGRIQVLQRHPQGCEDRSVLATRGPLHASFHACLTYVINVIVCNLYITCHLSNAGTIQRLSVSSGNALCLLQTLEITSGNGSLNDLLRSSAVGSTVVLVRKTKHGNLLAWRPTKETWAWMKV